MLLAQPVPPPSDTAPLITVLSPAVVAGVIAAIVAIAVALVTNGWQARRERERDRQLWRREDQHRFAELKRSAYADLIAALDSHRLSVSQLLRRYREHDEHGGSVESINQEYDRASKARESATEARANLELIAPDDIFQMAYEEFLKLAQVHDKVQDAHISKLQSEVNQKIVDAGGEVKVPNEHASQAMQLYATIEAEEKKYDKGTLLVAMRKDILGSRGSGKAVAS